MNTSTKYTIVSETGPNNFIKTVNEHLRDGRLPPGGVSSTFVNVNNPGAGAKIGLKYSQALVKY